MRNNTESNKIAKKYCKDFKYRLEDIYEDMFIISKLSEVKADKCNGKHFKNWENIKYRYFEVIQIMPDNDCVIIKTNLGGRLPENTKTFFNSTIINNLKNNRIQWN